MKYRSRLVLLVMIMTTEEIVASIENHKTELDIDLILDNLKYFLSGEIEYVSKECSLVIVADRNWTISG